MCDSSRKLIKISSWGLPVSIRLSHQDAISSLTAGPGQIPLFLKSHFYTSFPQSSLLKYSFCFPLEQKPCCVQEQTKRHGEADMMYAQFTDGDDCSPALLDLRDQIFSHASELFCNTKRWILLFLQMTHNFSANLLVFLEAPACRSS